MKQRSKTTKADRIRVRLPIDWGSFTDWARQLDLRLSAEAVDRSAEDGMTAGDIREMFRKLVLADDVIVSTAVGYLRWFDGTARKDDRANLRMEMDEVRIDPNGSIDLFVTISSRVARNLLSPIGREEWLDAVPEDRYPQVPEKQKFPTMDEGKFAAMLRNTLPNTAKLIGIMPIHRCVDQVVDLAMHDYEMAVALRDPAKRIKRLAPLHNAYWHPAPSRRQ